VFRYREPCAAVNVGAPTPQNIPKLAVDDTFIPEVVAPAAGGAVDVCTLSCPVVPKVLDNEVAPVTDRVVPIDKLLVRVSALLIEPVVTDIP
jgi:hypothetical protein